MSLSRHPSAPSHFKIAALGLVVSALALIPWFRNHAYLRDFYDYGLFINVNARLAQGQLPYTDFTTPAQSATFVFSYLAETLGGGTYLGLTRGAAALIILSAFGLMFMLARRFSPWIAALLTLAIVSGGASQHTIIFYNPIGVLATAMVVWSFAVAPLLRQETLGWHLVAAAGLLLGGTNKINFHLLACAMAAGWVIHAWVRQRAAYKRVLLTGLFILFFGAVLPVSLELVWTGAGWERWFYNVVQLPLSARGGRISALFSPALYLNTLHGYYGTLRVPQVGLIGLLMPLIAIVAALRSPTKAGRGHNVILLAAAGLLAAAASSALLLTNNEIAYVTFSAALVISIGLWIGFDVQAKGGWFAIGMLTPAVILGAAGWESAWRGQRSQFGHDGAPRENYVRGDQAGDEFRYIHGLHVPPSLVDSLSNLAMWRRGLPGDDATRIFYGPGVEWLEHIWPVRKVTGLPLVAAAFDGHRENELVKHEVVGGDTFRYVVVLEAWDYWNSDVSEQLNRTTMKYRMGPALMVYGKLKPGTVASRPIDFRFGGMNSNVDGTRITSDLSEQKLADGGSYLGTEQGSGRIDLATPCLRMSSEYVVARVSPTQSGPLTAQLAIYANLSGELLPRWSAEVTLPDGVNEQVVRTDLIDGSGLPLTLTVTVPDRFTGLVRAGWRGFELVHTVGQEPLPPMLQPGVEPLVPAGSQLCQLLLPASLQQAQTYIRRAVVADGVTVLPAGGEAWISLDGLYTDIKITTTMPKPLAGVAPRVLVVYYKGGRLENFAPTVSADQSTTHFTAWSPESGGWLGILSDPAPGNPPISVKIEAATPR